MRDNNTGTQIGIQSSSAFSEDYAFSQLSPELQKAVKYTLHFSLNVTHLHHQMIEKKLSTEYVLNSILELRVRHARETYGPDYPIDLIK